VTAFPFQLTVSFGGSGISSQHSTPDTFCLTQQEYAHDIVQMEFWGGDVDSDSLVSGMPVYISWGRAPQLREFYGYVNHASRTNNALAKDNLGRNSTSVTVVGASWPMKETATTAHLSMTSTQIIEQIAKQFGLSAKVVPHPIVWQTKQQAGMSYWQFCVELCKEIGYTFFCNGIQLTALPRQTDPRQLSNLAAVYDYRTDPASLPIFNPVLGANSPGGGQLRNRQLASINPRTGQVIYMAISGSNTSTYLGYGQEAPPFSVTETQTVDDLTHLIAKLQGSAQLNQMYITATAHGVGDARVCQGHLISVQNANGSQNGLWYLNKVEHLMTARNYTMNFECGRDSLGGVPISVAPVIALPPKATLTSTQSWVAA
jgi:hypothetical protein